MRRSRGSRRTARQEGQQLCRVSGQLHLCEARDDVSQRQWLIDQDGVLGQEQGRDQRVEFGLAERRSAECTQGVSLEADEVRSFDPFCFCFFVLRKHLISFHLTTTSSDSE